MAPTLVYRAPMRSRRDDVDHGAAVERALALGLCGVGGRLEGRPRDAADAVAMTDAAHGERVARRLERFQGLPDGTVVWTRTPDGRYARGTLTGPWRHAPDPAAYDLDLVHVRPCAWDEPVEEHRVPAAVVATYRRGGRNLQRVRGAEED
ncbi:GAF domain-containing protein [Nocardioides dongkuii]|uniref:GAF domain-containing protein n=1 Tax=Nocardioides dongkuii TaxID=2760089 RepID=UPI0015F83EEE|nr:GAF domain-containing protein [Nocardioides dongkuii]